MTTAVYLFLEQQPKTTSKLQTPQAYINTQPSRTTPPNSSSNNDHSIVNGSPTKTPQISQQEEEQAAKPALVTKPPKISIIIDDLGYQWRNGLRCIELDGAYTLAILPFSPFSKKLAQQADKSGKEVMLHAPMEPISHHSWNGGLDTTMNQTEIRHTLASMLKDTPMAKGINNHMGSAVTQNNQIMSWLMEEISARNLYFIDSFTTAQSQALLEAQQHGIPSKKRDVFLDNERNPKAIESQFNKLLALAKKHGSAIGIAHPYPETIAFLEGASTITSSQNIQLVPISQLLGLQPPGLAQISAH